MNAPIDVTTEEDIRLRGEILGPDEAPLVMLLHGGGQSRHAWAGTARRLAEDGFAVGTYDARGHGDSGWAADKDYSMPAHARDLMAVLRALARPTALVGASMGGISGLLAASVVPDLVRALVLVDIVPRFAPEGVARIRAFMQAHPEGFATVEEAAAAVHAYNPNRPRSKTPDGLMRSLREGADGRLRWHWDPAVVGDAPGAELTALLNERLAALPPSLPLMLVSGAQSDVVDADAVDEFRCQAPQAELVAVSRAGHMVAGDRNDDFSEAISGFLKRRMG
ncbi:MAG: alpha/beta hydrolase fold [Sphingomonas bacterium]|uniref:alpha/beta fold hydrolase n=1 Tax=Sphingomonas bacterium TaxID=1895847 RepID=UPI00261DFE7A|nr:alpha/beta hydrolase [Sphingomonas bacterium]MDB5711281.1 alpha/beta hydrolase fold [Sphingomonas bacterium]